MGRAKREPEVQVVDQAVQSPEAEEPWKSPPDLLAPALVNPPEYQNVDPEFNRAYVAGLCLKRFGLDHGVTDEMIYWLLSGAGEDSETACRRTMIAAWHIVRGFTDAPPLPVPQAWFEGAEGIETEQQWWESTEEEVKELLETKAAKEAAAEVESLEQELAQAKARLEAVTAK